MYLGVAVENEQGRIRGKGGGGGENLLIFSKHTFLFSFLNALQNSLQNFVLLSFNLTHLSLDI